MSESNTGAKVFYDDKDAPLFLLKQEEGNFLFGTKFDSSRYVDYILDEGKVEAILVGDRHHGSKHLSVLSKALNAPIVASKVEAPVLKKQGAEVDIKLELVEQQLDGSGISVLPTPGHTAGALSYYWRHKGKTVLFVGDTIVPCESTWKAWVNKPGIAKMEQTLKHLKAMKFDYVISNSFAADPFVTKLNASSKSKMLSVVAEQLGITL